MNTSNKTKKFFIGIAKKAMDITGGLPFKLIYGGRGHILMFHRVVEQTVPGRLWSNAYLEVTTQFLENAVRFYRKNRYEIIPIDLIGKYYKQRRRFVVLTFDDGYKDNYTLALPVLQRLDAPFTIYITTDFPDYKARLWWYNLEQLILHKQEVSIYTPSGTLIRFKCVSKPEKEQCFGKLRTLLLENYSHYGPQLFTEAELLQTAKKLCLSWDDIKRLSKQNTVTLGSHTISHANLTKLNHEAAKTEIFESKKILESRLKTEIKHFAYPFGSYEHFGAREINLVSEAGYKTATTTINLNINRFTYKPLKLPRIAAGMTMNPDSFKLIHYGILPMRRNHFKFRV